MKNKFVVKKSNSMVIAILLASVIHTSLVHSEVLKNDSEGVSSLYKKSSSGWTAERLKNAKPQWMLVDSEFDNKDFHPLEKKYKESLLNAFNDELPTESQGKLGQSPKRKRKPDYNNQVFEAEEIIAQKRAVMKDNTPTLVGTAGTRIAPYTSSKLIPDLARMYYPYRTVGRLFFVTDTGDSACSAAVISPRLIITAGHCLHSGNGDRSGWYSDFLFIPALENGNAPFAKWNGSHAWVNSKWFSGRGNFSNGGDIGLLVLQDQTLEDDNEPTRIGDWTGWLGWQINELASNHIHMLGYPSNFDRGLKMHQVTTQAFRVRKSTVEYGSDMEAGSSGGPWIENVGTDSRVVGVTSYGYDDPGLKLQGSSILNNDFIDGLTALCDLDEDNCD